MPFKNGSSWVKGQGSRVERLVLPFSLWLAGAEPFSTRSAGVPRFIMDGGVGGEAMMRIEESGRRRWSMEIAAQQRKSRGAAGWQNIVLSFLSKLTWQE